jgi:hypothetical protein
LSVSDLTRRDLFRLCGTACLTSLLGETMNAGQSVVPAAKAVDHLLLGTADLDRGIAWVEKLTGVRAAIGGSHPGVGTRNALISLGARQYLEIIAPDPAQATYRSRFEVRKLAEPRLITWAAATSDIESLARKLKGGGRQVLGPNDGSRARPDGAVLKWRTLDVGGGVAAAQVDLLPFFIQWSADSVHPSQDSPTGCTLVSFDITHPDPPAVVAALRELGIEAPVKSGSEVRIIATLDTPRGRVQLT